jgi:hypothetical protein
MHEVALKKNRGRRKYGMRSRARSLACEVMEAHERNHRPADAA